MAEIDAHFPEVLTLQSTELEAVKSANTGIPSTVAKWTGMGWEILRQGSIYLDN
jgi:L-threonylcarbamoyladenylate synthase